MNSNKNPSALLKCPKLKKQPTFSILMHYSFLSLCAEQFFRHTHTRTQSHIHSSSLAPEFNIFLHTLHPLCDHVPRTVLVLLCGLTEHWHTYHGTATSQLIHSYT